MGYKRIILYFVTWRVLLLVFVYFGIQFLPLQNNFLGGGVSNYLHNPYLWSWANFDGEHYLAIAQEGYKPLTYFFFPLYPILVGLIGVFGEVGQINYLYWGLVVSHAALLVGLIGLIRLIQLDYKGNVAKWTVILLLTFPTSFYFGSVYTESLFLALSIWSFYFARQRNWLLAGVLGGLSTATRISGLALLPALLWEYFLIKGKRGIREIGVVGVIRDVGGILLIPAGLLFYMIFLWKTTGDGLTFMRDLSIFGEQRAGSFILFPQVFYRYFFKVIPALNFDYFPIVFTTFLEVISALLVLGLGVLGILGRLGKIRGSYLVYLWGVFVISAFPGSFSSFPRYALSIFPVFIVLSLLWNKAGWALKFAILFLMTLTLAISTALFSRGYWIS